MAEIGDTFLFSVPRSHLWMVISAPKGPDGVFVMVNVSTERGYGEGTCILEPSDHPTYLTNPSEVRYKDAKRWQHSGPKGYNALLLNGNVLPQQPLTKSVLIKVQNGAFGSALFRYFDDVKRSLVEPLSVDDERLKIRRMAGIK